MKGTFKIATPRDVDVTMTLTMPYEDWVALHRQMEKHSSEYPTWKFIGFMSDMIRKAMVEINESIDLK